MFLSSNSKAPKIVAIILLVTSGIAIIFSLVTIGFSWGGLDVSLDFEHIAKLQSNCANTFGKQPNSIDAQACKTHQCYTYGASHSTECHGFQFCKFDFRQRSNTCGDCPVHIYTRNGSAYAASCNDITTIKSKNEMLSCRASCEANVGKLVQVCGVSQWDAGCSSKYLQGRLYWHTASGSITATVSAIFILVTSIPVMLNGIFGIVKKDVTSKVTGGIALGFAGCTCCATFVCLFSAISYMSLADEIADSLNEAFSEEAMPCTPECKASVQARQVLDESVRAYFDVLTAMCGVLLLLALAEAIVAAFSFSLFNRRVFDARRERASTRPGASATYSQTDFHTPVVIENAVIVDANGMAVTPYGQSQVAKAGYPPVAAAVSVVPDDGTAPAMASAVSVVPDDGTAPAATTVSVVPDDGTAPAATTVSVVPDDGTAPAATTVSVVPDDGTASAMASATTDMT